MFLLPLTVLSALATSAAAKVCTNQTVSVAVSARTAIFNVQAPTTNLDVQAFIQNLAKQGSNFTQLALTGYQTTSKTYELSTQFCKPDNAASTNPTVQVLTHGIGFDHT